VIGYVFESEGFSRIDIDTNESDPSYSLAGQLMGLPLKPLQGLACPPNPTASSTSSWWGRSGRALWRHCERNEAISRSFPKPAGP